MLADQERGVHRSATRLYPDMSSGRAKIEREHANSEDQHARPLSSAAHHLAARKGLILVLISVATRYVRYFRALVLIVPALLAGCGITYPDSASPPGAPTTIAPSAVVGQIVKTDQGQYTDLTAGELKAMMDHKD